MVKNSPFSAAGEGLIVGQGTRFPCAVGKLSLCIAIIEPMGSAALVERETDMEPRGSMPNQDLTQPK